MDDTRGAEETNERRGSRAGAMRIRRAAPGEAPALLAIFQSSVRSLASRDYTPAQIDAWAPLAADAAWCEAWRRRVGANHPWAVEIEARLVAYADLQPSGYLDHFYVAADAAGQGIGAALMRHLLGIAREQGIDCVVADVSLRARAFFERFGFAVEREQCVSVRGVSLRNARMRLAVAAAPAAPLAAGPLAGTPLND
ncbi:GNAT family N-acetyltransferase [Burkholderia gladioli]|uniref:GNAT family N-acetyltransferase n=1 Tax=Burkholderia gladioli TaxID=28095 RepID=UPI001F36426F|nr:GNAT family N-acetyltransferase [Burkholderia gladioli]MDN7464298.1 GNAT family N-acetyltransferase [Burkholderia gladioli]